MSNLKVHLRNLISGWGNKATGIIIAFFLSPFVVHTLGDIRYGIWSIILSVVGHMGISDIGLRRSVSKHLNQYIAQDDNHRAVQVISTSLAFMLIVGAVIIVLAFVIGRFFHVIFSDVAVEYMTEIRITLILAGIELSTRFIGSIFRRIIEAFNRFDVANALEVSYLLIRTSGVVGVLLISPSLTGLATVSLLASVIEVIALVVMSYRIWPHLQVSPSLCSKDIARELRDFGLPAFLENISYKIINHTGTLIIGILLSVQLVTIYSIGFMVVNYSWFFLIQIVAVLTPEIFKKTALEDHGATRHLFIRSVNATSFASVPVLIGFMFFADDFIRLWMGPEYITSAQITRILALSLLFTVFARPAGTIILGYGNAKLAASIFSGVAAIMNISLSILFITVFDYGIVGVALSSLIAAIITEGFCRPILACRMTELSLKTFVGKAVIRWIITLMFFTAICVVARTVPTVTWLAFFLEVVVVIILYIPVGWYILFDSDERKTMLLMFQKKQTVAISKT